MHSSFCWDWIGKGTRHLSCCHLLLISVCIHRIAVYFQHKLNFFTENELLNSCGNTASCSDSMCCIYKSNFNQNVIFPNQVQSTCVKIILQLGSAGNLVTLQSRRRQHTARGPRPARANTGAKTEKNCYWPLSLKIFLFKIEIACDKKLILNVATSL